MKNWEKYEKKIKEVISTNGCLCTLVSMLSNKNIDDSEAIANWLYEEYKEPLLTGKEKEYLKTVIKPFKDEIVYITKCYNLNNTKVYIRFIFEDERNNTVLHFNKGFDNIETYRYYSLKDLDLED